MVFSERLRSLIEENNITQKQLAIELQIPVSTLGGYVQGTSEPDFKTLIIIASYFNTTTDYLLGHHTKNIKNDRENEFLRILRALPEKQQQIYLEQGKAILKVNKNTKK